MKIKAYGIVDVVNKKLWCEECDGVEDDGRYYIFKSFNEAMSYLEKNEEKHQNSGVAKVAIEVDGQFDEVNHRN